MRRRARSKSTADNRHCYLTPRIGVSTARAASTIIYEAPRPGAARPVPRLARRRRAARSAAARQPEGCPMTRAADPEFPRHARRDRGAGDRNRDVLRRDAAAAGPRGRPSSTPHGRDGRAIIGAPTSFCRRGCAEPGAPLACSGGTTALVAVHRPRDAEPAAARLDSSPRALLSKPVRPSGVYTRCSLPSTSIAAARNAGSALRASSAGMAARRFVIKAVLALVAAARHRRRARPTACCASESMRQRVTVEELAVRLVRGGERPAAGSGLTGTYPGRGEGQER